MSWIRNPFPPMLLGVICALAVMFDYFIPNTPVGDASSYFIAWVTLLTAVVSWVGLINVLRFSVFHIRRRTPKRWVMSIFQIFLMVLMLYFGLIVGGTSGRWHRDPVVAWLYRNPYAAGSLGVGSIMGFFGVESVYRSMKARSFEAVVFIVCGILSMLFNAPVGAVAGIFEPLGSWIITYLYLAVSKVMLFGVGLGAIAYFVRYISGKETQALGAMEVAEE